MNPLVLNFTHNNVDKKKNYITTNYYVYKFYKKKNYKITFLDLGFKKNSYLERSLKLIKKKTILYREQISEQICKKNNILNIKRKIKWGAILDSWIYCVLSKVIYETDVLTSINKKLVYTKPSKNILFFKNSFAFSYYSANSTEFNIFFLNCILNNNLLDRKKILDVKKDFVLKKLVRNVFFYFIKFYLFTKKPILLNDSYFCTYAKIKIFFKSFGSIIFFNNFFNNFCNNDEYKIDLNSRKNLKIKVTDKYDSNFNNVLPYLLPLNFYENFNDIFKKNNFFKYNISLLGSGINIHTDDNYKLLCADMSEEKKLNNVVFQHGAFYEILKTNIYEEIEKKYSCKFYSWKNNDGLGVHNLSKFKKLNDSEISNNKEICLFTTYYHTYMTRFYSNFCPANYYNNDVNINFYNILSNNIKKNFLLRLFPYTSASEKKFFTHLLNESKFDSNNKLSSLKRIQKLRIFVADHISTPFFEAIFSNVPVIVYCDYKNYGFNQKFSSILASGQKNNIIHLNPENAANFINHNYENILDWWNSREVKRFRIRIKKYLFKEKNNYTQNLIEDLSKFKN